MISFNFFSFPALTGAVLILFCVAVPVAAEPLGLAVESALNYHPSVEAAVANRAVFREDTHEKQAGFYPRLNVRGTGGRIFGNNSTSRGLSVTRGEGYSYLWEGTATLTQMLYDGNETANRVDAAQVRVQSADYDILDTRENLALRTVLAYLDVLRGREAVLEIAKQAKTINSYLTRINTMVEKGAADATMSVQAQDVRAQFDNTLIGMEGQLRAAQVEYTEIVGHLPDDVMPRPVPRLDVIPDDADAALDYARDHHPMLKAAVLDEQAQAHDVSAEKSTIYPDFDGELSYLKRDQRDVIGGEVVDARALVRMNWEYSLAGAQRARVRKAQYRQLQSQAKRDETEKKMEKNIRISYNDRETSRQQLKILQERLEINQNLHKTYEIQFEGARVNLLQLLQSDNAVFNARLSLINGTYKSLASQYAILASMGRLQDALDIVPASNDDNE